ncbi:hypothetical protein GCM10018966_095630 [Streptomyces yanii]
MAVATYDVSGPATTLAASPSVVTYRTTRMRACVHLDVDVTYRTTRMRACVHLDVDMRILRGVWLGG